MSKNLTEIADETVKEIIQDGRGAANDKTRPLHVGQR